MARSAWLRLCLVTLGTILQSIGLFLPEWATFADAKSSVYDASIKDYVTYYNIGLWKTCRDTYCVPSPRVGWLEQTLGFQTMAFIAYLALLPIHIALVWPVKIPDKTKLFLNKWVVFITVVAVIFISLGLITFESGYHDYRFSYLNHDHRYSDDKDLKKGKGFFLSLVALAFAFANLIWVSKVVHSARQKEESTRVYVLRKKPDATDEEKQRVRPKEGEETTAITMETQ